MVSLKEITLISTMMSNVWPFILMINLRKRHRRLWHWKCWTTMFWGLFLLLSTIIHLSKSEPSSSTNNSIAMAKRASITNVNLVKRETSYSTNGVNVVRLQRFLVEPENVTVNIGESIILPCRVSNKAGTVQWTRDGFGLGADQKLEGFPTYSMMNNDATGDYSLKISSVTLEDDAVFQCQVGALDNVPGIRSQSAKLTIRVRPEDPVIVLGNSPGLNVPEVQVLSTTAGTKIELTCEAHGGRPAAELSWINSRNRTVKKGITSKITTMNDGKRFNSALKWTFEPTKSDHNKRLYCRSSHPTLANSTSAAILLEVKYAPEVKLEVSRIVSPQQQQPPIPTQHTNSIIGFGSGFGATATNLHGRIGDTIKFKCIADGNPGRNQLMFEWFKNNEVIFGDHGNELIIDNIDKSFNGAEIVCRVSNSIGTGSASITLNIAYGPSFLPSMEYVYGVNPGDTVRLSCPVEGNPTPEITWIKVGTSSVMSSGSKLTIRNVNEDSVGEYLCRVSVKGFPEISAIVYLRLNGPPKIRKKQSSTRHQHYAVLGEPGHIECLIESVPAPIAITWIHNGQIFTSGSTNSIPINIDIHEEKLKEEAVVMRASFDIRNTLQHDFGYYNCVVVNSYGSDWHLVSLDEKTSFSTIVIIVSISISILVFIVLSTIILLLMMKHRKLIKEQQQQQEQHEQDKQRNKEQFIADDSDNHNIYSTHSTRTNSSSDKNGPTETGTIITHSGSTGSPRSSTSSFPAYIDQRTNSPATNGSRILGNHHGQHNHSSSSTRPSPHPHIHHPLTTTTTTTMTTNGMFPDPPRSPPFFSNGSIFDENDDLNSPMNTSKTEIVAMPALNATAYSSLSRHLALSSRPLGRPESISSIRNSYSPYVTYQHLSSYDPVNTLRTGMFHSSLNHHNRDNVDMYQANPYQVSNSNQQQPQSSSSRLLSTPMPTPPPSLAKELDNCISKNSIATHV